MRRARNGSLASRLDETPFLATLRTFVGQFDFSPDAMSRTLLIIDDNKSVRESLRFLLERRGYVVLVAENGPDGIALAQQHAVDGALLDVNMPRMNGISVCRTLRAAMTGPGRTFPIWMMTGARTPTLTQSALDAGALALLPKPFNYPDLFRRFDEQFGGAPAPPGN